ncbi:MAG: 3-methyladenine DNA glycosylase [Planctomycetaceae bacterium]|nr:3-methyladenine DNA glycosylase [Planctomycetaceae bacterium]MBP61761.1 3-methyladenine DNA glycosylase [Planctomycetaceae bacterium]
MNRSLPRKFFNRDPVTVAREMLGALLIRETEAGVTEGRIVETEAYLAEGDTACHAHRGPTRRNAAMFGAPGHAYVYTIHAKFCLNAVTQAAGTGSAVLIRAIEPLSGLELMSQRRQNRPPRDLTRGPARLCQALDVDLDLNGWDLTRGDKLWLAREKRLPENRIGSSVRIGISSAQDLKLRFYVRSSGFLSGPARLNRS